MPHPPVLLLGMTMHLSIRQPHTTNVSESRFSSQRSLASGTMATYNGAAFVYRDMILLQHGTQIQSKNTVKVLFQNNGTQMTTGPNNQPLKPDLDLGSCSVPSLASTWQAYGWRDWAVTDERCFWHYFFMLPRPKCCSSHHRIVEWDI